MSQMRFWRVEALERRLALATDIWTGLASLLDSNWSLGLNWSTLTAPSNGDDVEFNGILLTTSVNDISNLSLHSITFAANNFSLSGNAITLMADGGGITMSGGATGTETIGLDIVLAGDQTITLSAPGATLKMAGDLSGAGGITEAGAGQMILSGTNTYDGATTVSAGTLTSGIGNALPTTSDLTVSAVGTFDDAGFSQTLGSIAGAGTITDSGGASNLTISGSGATTFSGMLSGPMTLIRSGSGSLYLSKPTNAYSGGTDVNGGVLEFAAGALGSGGIDFGGGTLQYAGGNTQDVSARILNSAGPVDIDPGGNAITFSSSLAASNTGGLGVVGNGTLDLAGANVYSGATQVEAGELLVDGATGAGSSVEVHSGATLGGNGNIGGAVIVESGGAFAPGDPTGGPGNLHTGGLTFLPGSVYAVQLNGTLPGTNYDQALSAAAIDLGGATLEASLGFTPSVGDSFTIGQAVGLVSGTFGGLAEGAMLFIGGRLFDVSYAAAGGQGITLSVVQATLTVSGILAADKTYDGTTAATLDTSGATVNGIVPGDPGVVLLNTTGAVGAFASRNADNGVAVSVAGLTINGSSAVNYVLVQPTLLANITPRTLNVSATAQDKIYDGATAAAVTLSDDRITGDALTVAYAGATFSDRNAGDGKTVVATGLSLSGADAGNYVLAAGTTTALADILPMALTITASPDTRVYDGTVASGATPVVTGGMVIAGDVTDFLQSFAAKDAGNNLLLIPDGSVNDGNGGNNYAITFVPDAVGTILPRVLHVTASGNDKIYDGTAAAGVSLADDRLAGDDVVLGFGAAEFSDKNVGSAKTILVSGLVISSGADAADYTLASTTAGAVADIDARALNVTAAAQDKTYDGTVAAMVALGSDAVAGDDVTLSYATADFGDKNVGVAKAVSVGGIAIAGGADAGNYLLASTTATASATISARPLNITAAATSKIYDGTAAAAVTLTGDALATDDVDITFTAAAFSDKDVGAGKNVTISGVGISGTDATNYTLASSTLPATADIAPRPLNIVAVGQDRTYDGFTDAAVSLSSDAIAGDSLSLHYANAAFGDKNVGVGKAINVSGFTVQGADALNYALTSTSGTATADITSRPLTIVANAQSKVYDGTTTASVVLSGDGLPGDALVLDDTTATFADKNVGVGKSVTVAGLLISGADAGNYSLTAGSTSTTANITPRTLNITATAQDKIYDGTRTASVILAGDSLPGDDVAFSAAGALFADRNAGVGKAVAVSGLSIGGADAGNYQLAAVSGSALATIMPRAISITAVADTKIYDGAATSSATPIITTGALAVGDSATVAENFNTRNAGSDLLLIPVVTINDGNNGDNYTVTLIPDGNGTILPRPLVVTAAAQDKTYDGTTSAVATLSDNAVAGDAVSVAYASASFANKSVGGAKSVLISGLAIQGADAGNYTLQAPTATASASITPRPLHATITGLDKIYDGTTAAALSISDDALFGDVVNVDYTAAFSDKNAHTDKPITVSAVFLSGADAGNYALASSLTGASADIDPRTLTVSVIDADKVYDGTPATDVSFSDDRVAGDRLRIHFASATFPDKNVGADLPVSITGLSLSGKDAGNYTLAQTSLDATGTISPRPLHVIATARDKNYDGTSEAAILLSDDQVPGDSVAVSYASAGFVNFTVGAEQPVLVSGIAISGPDAGNYILVSTTATAFANIDAPIIPPDNPNPPVEPNPPPTGPVLSPQSPLLPGPPTVPPPDSITTIIPVSPPPTRQITFEPLATEALSAIPRSSPAALVLPKSPVAVVEPFHRPIDALVPPSMDAIVTLNPLPVASSSPVRASQMPPVTIPEPPPGISRLGLFIKFSITAGFVIQFVVPRSVLASLFTSLPAWRWFDPVPILKAKKRGLVRPLYDRPISQIPQVMEMEGFFS